MQTILSLYGAQWAADGLMWRGILLFFSLAKTKTSFGGESSNKDEEGHQRTSICLWIHIQPVHNLMSLHNWPQKKLHNMRFNCWTIPSFLFRSDCSYLAVLFPPWAQRCSNSSDLFMGVQVVSLHHPISASPVGNSNSPCTDSAPLSPLRAATG